MPARADHCNRLARLRAAAAQRVQRHRERLRHRRGIVGARLGHEPAERCGRAHVAARGRRGCAARACSTSRTGSCVRAGTTRTSRTTTPAPHTTRSPMREALRLRAERGHAPRELVAHDRRPLVPAERVRRGDREELRRVRELGGVGAADRGAGDLEHDVGAGADRRARACPRPARRRARGRRRRSSPATRHLFTKDTHAAEKYILTLCPVNLCPARVCCHFASIPQPRRDRARGVHDG